MNKIPSMIVLDTETTGLYPGGSVLWSMGIEKNNKEAVDYFIQNNFSDSKESFLEHSRQQSIFQKNQVSLFESGNTNAPYRSYIEAIESNKLLSRQQAMTQLLSSLDGGGMLMAQNINFENRWIHDLATDTGMFGDLRDRMLYASDKAEERGLFYRPPSVTIAALESRRQFDVLMGATGTAYTDLLEGYMFSHDKVIQAYDMEAQKAANAGRYVIGDLQDFTKALYASAAYSGKLGKEALNARTTNVEFLGQLLYGELETHSSKKDAELQSRIYKDIRKYYDELKSGNISESTAKVLDNFNKALPHTRSVSMWSSAKQALEELDTQGFWNNFNGALPDKTSLIRVANLDTNTLEAELDNPNYNAVRVKNEDDVIKSILGRYQNVRGSEELSNLLSAYSGQNLRSKIAEKADQEKKSLQIIIDNIRNGTDPKPGIAEKVITVVKDKIPKSISKNTRIAIGAGVVATLFALSGDNEPKDRFAELAKQQAKTPAGVFQQFDNINNSPIIYHGTGFYNWENRTRHHE